MSRQSKSSSRQPSSAKRTRKQRGSAGWAKHQIPTAPLPEIVAPASPEKLAAELAELRLELEVALTSLPPVEDSLELKGAHAEGALELEGGAEGATHDFSLPEIAEPAVLPEVARESRELPAPEELLPPKRTRKPSLSSTKKKLGSLAQAFAGGPGLGPDSDPDAPKASSPFAVTAESENFGHLITAIQTYPEKRETRLEELRQTHATGKRKNLIFLGVVAVLGLVVLAAISYVLLSEKSTRGAYSTLLVALTGASIWAYFQVESQ